MKNYNGDNNLPGAKTPAVNSEIEDDNIGENVVTGDDDNSDNDNNGVEGMSGDNKDDNSEGEDLVSNNDNTNSTTVPSDADLPWMSLFVVADDDIDNDPDDYDEFYANYDLDDDSVFDNDDGNVGEG